MKRATLCCLLAAALLAGLAASSRVSAGGEGSGDASAASRDAAADAAELVLGNSTFAFDLYGGLRARPGNLFLSPYSISTALSMTYVGARGRTEEQMNSALRLPGFGLPEGGRYTHDYRLRLAESFGSLIESQGADASDGGHVLAEANALWCQEGYPFLDSFLSLNVRGFGAGPSRLDFAGDTEGARVTINSWVEEETHGRIEDLIRPGDLDGSVRIVLTNAVYFKGMWSAQFDPRATRDASFRRSPGEPGMDVTVPMMSRKGTYAYARVEGAGMQIAELPYEGDRTSMLVLLPDEDLPQGLATIEERLSVENLETWLSLLGEREITLSLPRFSMTWGTEDIIPELEALGVIDLFSAAADLSGVDGTKELYVSHVLHKAFVDVNEEGTEAAAATAVVGRLKASMPLEFRADRPFLFLIRDLDSGSILFMGRVTDPTA